MFYWRNLVTDHIFLQVQGEHSLKTMQTRDIQATAPVAPVEKDQLLFLLAAEKVCGLYCGQHAVSCVLCPISSRTASEAELTTHFLVLCVLAAFGQHDVMVRLSREEIYLVLLCPILSICKTEPLGLQLIWGGFIAACISQALQQPALVFLRLLTYL